MLRAGRVEGATVEKLIPFGFSPTGMRATTFRARRPNGNVAAVDVRHVRVAARWIDDDAVRYRVSTADIRIAITH